MIVSVGQLLAELGKTKRSLNTIKTISKALSACKLTTSPNFTAVGINEQIQIVLKPKKLKSAPEVKRGNERNPIITYPTECFSASKCCENSVKHVGAEMAPRANSSYPKWFVKPKKPLEAAVAILSQQEVDYVPPKALCEQIKGPAVFVDESDPFYDSMNLIQKHGYVIVKSTNEGLFTILRASDLAQELLALTERLLLLHEIEEYG